MKPIRIDQIRVLEINLPLRIPFQISGGVMRSRRSLIVELHSEGQIGYGESAPFEAPFYSSETLGSVWALWRDLLIPRLEGATFDSIEAFDAALRDGVRGNPFARCGLENAFWDLVCVREKRTYQELMEAKLEELGVAEKWRRREGHIASGVAVGIPEDGKLDTLRRWIDEYLAEGYRRVKIKIKPGWDVEACRVARAAVGDGFPLWPDANASFNLREHGLILQKLEQFEMLFLEQPLHHDDLLDHAELSQALRTPVCLDESLKDARVAEQAVRIGAGRVWNIKIQRMGGILEALRVYAIAVKHGIKLWGGTMPESGIGAQPILALSSFAGFVYPADVEPSARWYEPGADPVAIAMSRDGWIEVPRFHGVGELIDPELYRRSARVLFP